ncbi:MAG TPA: hypothetical protein VGH83_03515 [Candidatus Acidoferrum sp.]|jgi:hypothetical protein
MRNRISAYATLAANTILTILLAATLNGLAATENRKALPQDNAQAAEPQPADGHRHGKPAETYAVAPGTKFLVVLEQDLTSKDTQENAKFVVRTVEPLEAGSGIYLPAGAEIRGHVSRLESAGTTGRAKIWLTFDDIYTKFGALPIVAEVAGVPGDHSVKPSTPNQEGMIEGRSSTQQAAAQSAAAGAANGAVKGVKDKDKKEAAEGAALGALTAYLVESGRGHELNLPKGAKLELELERVLYLLKE